MIKKEVKTKIKVAGIGNVALVEEQYEDEPITKNICSSINDFYNLMHLLKKTWPNKKLIRQFLEHSQSNFDKNNFFKEEISILNPDIIITLRLWKLNKKITEYIDGLIFDKKTFKFNFIKGYGKKDKWNYVTLNSIVLKRKKIPMIDMGHFSMPGKSIKTCI
jgi:hypothetical protein